MEQGKTFYKVLSGPRGNEWTINYNLPTCFNSYDRALEIAKSQKEFYGSAALLTLKKFKNSLELIECKEI